ncbi:cell envelope integrity protein CreD [Xanthomonas sp. NCPPB 2654]|jgi:inner membrane protein|uniref:cell envelope integrity protein CreD n=1 Tax=unclassified Xanthomonas TaxID=2643310 RepID=UPI0021DF89E0|nr:MULTISPECIES: cell envelope integrity protein CreD [unclassified Xanthomonas]MDL5367565.1 cell envelope integrity protein CreD [Xanthomonas sp. NCPPB 2654]MEB1530703.1 cell envelope integrity protein CreD [Xanthomonas campestris pv. campestris]UYC19367.1 cell envelope integrity protein CreD [Xanthomonas sp. CFBP 8443]
MKSLKLVLRFATIGGLILLLLIPLLMIRGTISGRERYRDEAVERVSQSKAGEQRLLGPMRVLPWSQVREVAVVDADGKRVVKRETETGYDLQTPRHLAINGEMKPSQRSIGLFKVQVYSLHARLKAQFDDLDYEEVDGRTYGQPYLVLGIEDVRGLVGTPNLRADGKALGLQPGSLAMTGISKGVHAVLPALADARQGRLTDLHSVEMEFVLDGTQALSIVPVGDDNQIALTSPWPHPLFGGRFLPNERRFGPQGFQASWALSSLATGAQSQLATGSSEVDALRVDLVDPVDVYTQADRASKYGILFVVLTFVAFGLFELIKRLPIHPLQYLLVGLALAIFFLLLLSLSEHIAFWQAYLISAVACIGLQFFYLAGVLRSRGRAAGFASMLTLLYGALYGLLASEDSALLMGSLLLFGILAAIMWITRKIDWYELGAALR